MQPSLILRLLRTVSWPHWRGHALRTAMTLAGVSLGVATIVSIANVSTSVLASFNRMMDTLAGPVQLEVTNAGAGVDEALLEDVARVRGVRSAAGMVESFLSLADSPSDQLFVLGMDFLGSPVWEAQFPRDAIDVDDPFVFVAQPDSIAVSEAFLRRHALERDDELAVLSPLGRRTLRIRGVLDDRGPAKLFGGAVALMDLPAAQRLLQREGRVDRIAMLLAPDEPVDAVRDRAAAAVGSRGTVDRPESRGREAEMLLHTLRVTLAIMSLGAIIVGATIVYQSVSVSVHQRRGVLAVLSAIGIRRRSLVALCVAETAILAASGGVLGVAAGSGLARVAAGAVGDVASQIWLRIGTAESVVSVRGALVAVAVGVLAACLAAWAAARSTLSAPAVDALRAGGVSDRGAVARPAAAAVVAAVLLAAVWLVVLAPRDLGFAALVTTVIGTQACGFIALAVVAPLLVRAMGAAARQAATAAGGLSLRLAAENVATSATRSGATVVIVASAFGIATIVAVLTESNRESWLGWVRNSFSADLYVGRGEGVRLIAGPTMSRSLGDRIAALDGVDAVEPFRTLPLTFRGRPVFLVGIATAVRAQRRDVMMLAGTLADARPGLEAGTSVIVSENFAYRFAVDVGDEIELPTPGGPRRMRVDGVFVDYLGSLDLGSIAVDIRHVGEVWGDGLANLFRVWLRPGASAEQVRGRILASAGPGSGLYVLTTRDYLDGIRGVINAFFAAVWALEVVAAIVGVIGVVNAQLASVYDRAREITVLHAIGIRGSAIRRMLAVECGQIGLMGGVAGALLGLMLGAQIVLVSARLVTGWRMAVVPPWTVITAGLAITVALSLAAGIVPARAGERLRVTPGAAD